MDWLSVRDQFPVLDKCAYLNTGTFGPIPLVASEAMSKAAQEDLHNGRIGLDRLAEMRALRDEIRGLLAGVVGASAAEIAITTSTICGINKVVAGLRLSATDEVVTTSAEHHALMTSLQSSGAQIRVVDVVPGDADATVDALLNAVGTATRLIAVSHVLWTNGETLPVERLAGHGPAVLVDAAQSVGAIEVDLNEQGCDFVAFPGQKWLLGPDGVGGLYVRGGSEQLLRNALPFVYGHDILPEGDVPLPGAVQFDHAAIDRATLEAFKASLRFSASLGNERYAHAARMTVLLKQQLANTQLLVETQRPTTLVSIQPRQDPDELARKCHENGVLVRVIPGTGYLRASVGFWTSEEDIQRFVELVAAD